MVRVECGDSRDVLKTLADESIDACVTDPPYSLVSIQERFGKPGSAPAQEGRDGLYRRASTGFMGKQWDTGETAFDPAFWAEVLRVLKPGAHLLAFGGTRSYHRLACAIEDAGFEIRDQIGWLYGSGFPKSHDVSKGIDKAAGAEREKISKPNPPAYQRSVGNTRPWMDDPDHKVDSDEPATEAARQWQGWGTALKPSFEPVVVARKPLGEKTVAANVLRWGTGALNIDACRVTSSTGQRPNGDASWVDEPSLCASCAEPAESTTRPATLGTKASSAISNAELPLNGRAATSPPDTSKTAIGCSAGTRADAIDTSLSTAEFGKRPTADQSRPATKSTTTTRTGETTDPKTCSSCGRPITSRSTNGSTTAAMRGLLPDESSSEPAAPAGRWPSNTIHDGSDEVLEAFARSGERPGAVSNGKRKGNGYKGSYGAMDQMPGFGDTGTAARFFYHAKADKDDRCGSKHPTVKPVDLMAYLCRLVTPPGGTVLDPFAGSGATGAACLREGFKCILIEREAEYIEDINRRLAHVKGSDTPLFAERLTPLEAAIDSARSYDVAIDACRARLVGG